jgi:PTS system cellobiose-specific IIA component
MTDQSEEAVFKLILHGGNARGEAYEALDAAEDYNFDEAKKHLNAAEDEFLQGHKYQTETIRNANDGHTPSFLMVHAQDHVMTAQAELNLIKRLVTNYKQIEKLEKRIEALEKKES